MRGAIPAFPNTPSWRSAQLKHRDYVYKSKKFWEEHMASA